MAHLYLQLEQQLSRLISAGRLVQGDKLPSIRSLCNEYQMAKGTVLHALERLEARGLIEARPRSGYYVCLAAEQKIPSDFVPAPLEARVSDVLLEIMQAGSAFDLCPGAGDESTTGLELLNRSMNRAMRQQRGKSHLYYDSPYGLAPLREQLRQRLLKRGLTVSQDEICITSGCQNSLFLALMATCQPGDTVAVESPGFYGVLQLLEQLKLRVIEIPSSSQSGMMMDALQAAAEKWGIRACVVSPCFSTPTGALMPEHSRVRLLEMAETHDFAVIEDDIYADTALGVVPDPLKSLDTTGRVILCSSFSKTLSKDLRVGWISAGRWHKNVVQLKLVTQLASPTSVQKGVTDFIASGAYTAHLKRQQHRLKQQRDQLLAEIRSWQGVHTTSIPEGGLSLWVELTPERNTLTLFHSLKSRGVMITPGTLFSNEDKFKNALRISYFHPWNKQRLNALNSIAAILERP